MKADHKVAARRVLTGIGYLGLYMLASAIAVFHGDYQPWSLAPALSLALLARRGLGWLPLTVLAPLAIHLAPGSGLDPFWAFARASIEAAACAGAAMALRAHNGQDPDLARPGEVGLFCAVAALASLIIATGRGIEAAATGTAGWPVLILSFRLFLAGLVAMLTVTPVLMIARLPRKIPRLIGWVPVELLLQAGALVIISWEVFAQFVNAEIHFFYLLFLPFAWIATRHGQHGAALALAAVYLAPVASDRFFPHQDQAILELQIRVGVLAVTTLLLGAMVSERKRAEARMLARQTELAHFQRLNVGWEMASALAHELTQPLTAAMNYTQAALRLIKAPDPDLDRAARVMAQSVNQIERAGQTIHGLRDFMRKGELRLARTALSDVVDDSLLLVAGEANAGGVLLQAKGLAGLPPVMADKTQIVQVLINLVRNAVQTLASAGIESGIVTVSAQQMGDFIELTVADNGPGLAPNVLAHLFEPFVTTKEAGMGLGLSISKSILEAHDGKLTAENAPRGGALFRFTLPLADQILPDGEMADA